MTNVLLATSNGTGMGHLTRQAAVGLALAGEHEATLFSLALGLPLATALGIRGEYCPSHDRPWIATQDWHAYLRDRLLAIVEETEAEVVLFDGVAPYPGLGQATTLLRQVAFVWLRRGMWRQTSRRHLAKTAYFDMVIEPGDLAGDADTGPTVGLNGVRKVAPISLTQVLDPLSRLNARKALNLPADGEVALVTLGSGRLGDIAGPGEVVIRALLERRDLHIAVTSPAVAENQIPLDATERVTEIQGVYPLVPHLPAFDLAVSSAGYNAVHEMIPSGVPTLFVANTSTQTDDQVSRGSRIAQLGLGMYAVDNEPESVARGVEALVDEGRREEIIGAALATRAQMTGATETAERVASFGSSFSERRRKPSVVVSTTLQLAKDRVKGMLGDEATARVKRLLGRTPSAVAERATVHLVDQPQPSDPHGPLALAVTDTVSVEQLRAALPVEHLLPAAGAGYKERRLEIIRRYYDVAG